MDVIDDQDHPELMRARTDPAELAWHLYRHHGVDLTGLAGASTSELWELHRKHHGA